MKYLISVFFATFLIPLTANAGHITWYLDDPAMGLYGGVTYDGTGVVLDLTGFSGTFTETWTGSATCVDPGSCTATSPVNGNTYGTNAVLELIFDLPLFIADIASVGTVGVTVNTYTAIGNGVAQIFMTTTFIPTPPSNPNLVPVPATIALLGLGLVGLGWSRRRNA